MKEPMEVSSLSGLRYIAQGGDVKDHLVLLLHGYGKHYRDLLDPLLALDPGLPLISIQAPYRLGPGAYRWFGYQAGSQTDALEDEEAFSLARLASLVEELRSDHAATHIWLMGHSQGAMLSLHLALSHAELVSGCVALNGRLLPQAARHLHEQPAGSHGGCFLFAHGEQDTIIPMHKGLAAHHALLLAGRNSMFTSHTGGHEVSMAMLNGSMNWLIAQQQSTQRGVS